MITAIFINVVSGIILILLGIFIWKNQHSYNIALTALAHLELAELTLDKYIEFADVDPDFDPRNCPKATVEVIEDINNCRINILKLKYSGKKKVDDIVKLISLMLDYGSAGVHPFDVLNDREKVKKSKEQLLSIIDEMRPFKKTRLPVHIDL